MKTTISVYRRKFILSLVGCIAATGCTTNNNDGQSRTKNNTTAVTETKKTTSSDTTDKTTTRSATSTQSTEKVTENMDNEEPNIKPKTPKVNATAGLEEAGEISARTINKTKLPSEATVVNAADDRIDDVKPIQQLVRRTARNGKAVVEVKNNKIDEVKQAFEKIPKYNGKYGPVYYIEYQGEIIRLGVNRQVQQ